jgi:hypothetical protein
VLDHRPDVESDDLRQGDRADVGLYVREARERDLPVKTFTVPVHDVDRAVTDAEDVGLVKIHVEERGDRILGATIVGRHAGEIINEITLAMVAGVGLPPHAPASIAPRAGAAVGRAPASVRRVPIPTRADPGATSDAR